MSLRNAHKSQLPPPPPFNPIFLTLLIRESPSSPLVPLAYGLGRLAGRSPLISKSFNKVLQPIAPSTTRVSKNRGVIFYIWRIVCSVAQPGVCCSAAPRVASFSVATWQRRANSSWGNDMSVGGLYQTTRRETTQTLLSTSML